MKRALIVADESVVREPFRDWLGDGKYEVVHTANPLGPAALENRTCGNVPFTLEHPTCMQCSYSGLSDVCVFFQTGKCLMQ